MRDETVRIEHLVVRVPASALGVGAGDEPARRYARQVAEALARELAGSASSSAASSAHVGRARVRVADGTDPDHVAHRIAQALPGAIDGGAA